MGLTSRATGLNAISGGQASGRASGELVIALAGNPNVGKSTVFNGLTGMNQHTGNWPGKTVASAQGRCRLGGRSYALVDLPGTYSLLAHSAEEEIARDFICFDRPDAMLVVCDATCLERSLNLVLQVLEITPRVAVCVNLMDEARRKGIRVDLARLSARLGVPVTGTVARRRGSLEALSGAVEAALSPAPDAVVARVAYPDPIEAAVALLLPALSALELRGLEPRWLALRLLEGDAALARGLEARLGGVLEDPGLREALRRAEALLEARGLDREARKDAVVGALVGAAEALCQGVVSREGGYDALDRRIDRVVTSRRAGYPIMIALLALVFWITIAGANYPSALLSRALFALQDRLSALVLGLGAPVWLHDMLVLGAYRVLAWVVSVMLPPMAVFFPLFTLLEDAGYLPRIAYNLDGPFRRCRACGKQALTMCMGFGCNAAGVVGCRIIDSPRERLLAILTNSFVPCNGRFPTLIALLSMFFIGGAGGLWDAALSAAGLTAAILLGVGATFLATRLLSVTLLRGLSSAFTLELPPYRRPQIGRVIVRSLLDRTLFVLGRAAAVAVPAGLAIWAMANLRLDGQTLLARAAGALDPFARLLGLDGTILIAFILGLPANEIVVPVIVMAYTAQGTLVEAGSLAELRALLAGQGWTWVTALCTMLFSLMHWPCSTTLLTIKKETGSWRWTALALALPTLFGMAACFIVATAARLLG